MALPYGKSFVAVAIGSAWSTTMVANLQAAGGTEPPPSTTQLGQRSSNAAIEGREDLF